MDKRFEKAIGYLLDGYKKANGPAGPPKDPELKTALYEAATFLEAAGKVDKAGCLKEADDILCDDDCHVKPCHRAAIRRLLEALPDEVKP